MLKFADCNMAVGQPNAISGWRIYDSAQIACQAQRCGIQKGLAFCNAALDLHPLDGNAEMCLICRREPFYLPVWMVMPNHTGEFWNVDELERRMRLADVRAVRLAPKYNVLRIYEAMRQREAQLPPLPRLAGVHLEGPYFSQKERGAQDETIIRLPDAAEYERILEQAPCLRRWSIACELPGALELGERLHKRGIMASVGHSDATTAQVYEAFGRGFHSVTHLYSGCSVLHRNGPHREGGVVEAAFLIDEMDVEVIADGVHLPPDFLRLIYKIKGPEHIALITDSIRAGAADVPEGTVVYDDKEGRRPICIKGGVAVMPDGKNFAGSIATTSRLVRTMVQRAGVELTAAVRMAALTPARMLGMDAEIGSIAVGKRADLLLLDSGLQVQGVIRDGKQVIDNRLN